MTTDIVALTMNPAIDVSTTFDRLTPYRKLRCAPPKRDAGGGGINVARVVRRFGSEVTAVYPAGGSIGGLLERLVVREGVRSVAVPIAEETREDFTVVEAATGQQYRFVLPGPQMSEPEWRACLDALVALDGRPLYLVASGSLPPGVPDDLYARVARVARDWGAKLVLDTSGPALRAALNERVHLVKPNRRELEGLTGGPIDSDAAGVAACRAIVAAGQADICALTLGDEGALLVTRDQAWRAPALPIKLQSAVGAGDSFVGGMVWSLAAGHGIEQAFRYAMAASAAALLAPGTELCRREDVERLLPQVVVRAM